MHRPLFGSLICVLTAGLGAVHAQPPAQKLNLTLAQAVEMAVRNNLQTRLAGERTVESRAQQGLAASALLPNVSGSAYQMNLTSNLAAMGFKVGTIPGFPTLVGPFNRFDARFQLYQSVFDLASIHRYRAAGQGVALAADQRRLAVQQVTTAATLAYLAVLEAEQAVVTAQSNAQLGARLLELARSQREAGVATGVDVARAETRLAGQQVQLAQAQTSLDTARLNLLRVIGAPLASEVALAETMRFAPEPAPDAGEAVSKALADRLDLKVAADALGIAEARRKAAAAERLPSVSFVGDYGSSGIKVNETNLPTRSVGIRVEVPVFDGGRTRSEIQAASSQQRQAEMQWNDLRAAVEKDVRLALDNLATRQQQVLAAQKAVSLAERELEMAQDRFQSGVADNVEVVNAQTVLESARHLLVASLAQFHVARLNLASAMGHAEDFRL